MEGKILESTQVSVNLLGRGGVTWKGPFNDVDVLIVPFWVTGRYTRPYVSIGGFGTLLKGPSAVL